MGEGLDAQGRGNEVVRNADSGSDKASEEQEARSCSRTLLDGIKGLPESYLRTLVRCPCCLFVLMQLLVAVLVGALWKGGDLNTDFSDFLRANTGASLRYDAMQQAWRALEPPSGRRLQSGRQIAYRHTMATLAYYKEDGGNLLEERSLFAIRNYERTLQATAEWQFFCGNAIVGIQEATAAAGNATNQTVTEAASPSGQQISCAPGESLVNYIWPSYDSPSGISVGPGETQQLLMDGTGSRFFPVEAVVSALRDGTDRLPQTMNRLARLFPKDFVAPEGGERPHTDTLRSFFLFSQAYGPDGYYDSSSAAGVDRQRFHGGDLHNLLRRQDTVLQESGIRVFYSSGLLDEADIFSALFADVMLSVGGLALVFLMICLHTQSLLLSSVGALLVLECIPLGYVFFKQFSNLPKISIVNCVSTFVIIGVGSDLVFLLTDAWRQSANRATVPEEEPEAPQNPSDDPELDPDPHERAVLAHQRHLYRRIAWVYSNAGISSVTTGLCGASSFLVNLLSVLMPLREFGLFMGLCCIFALALEVVMFPMALLMRETWRFRKLLKQQEQQEEDLHAVGVVVPTGSHPKSVVPIDAVTTNAGDVQTLKSRSFLVRFFAGFWSNFLERYKLYVIVCFVLSTLVSLVGIATTLSVDGSPPVIFPESHNQILGRKIFDRFETAVAVSASPAQEQSYICDIGVQPLRARADTSVACGTFTSTGWCTSEDKKDVMNGACSNTCGLTGACFATWCPVEDAPNVTKQEPGRCDCYQETSAEVGVRPAQAPPGIVRFETSVVGFSKESWMSLEPHLRGLYLSLAGPPGSGFSQTSSYRPALDEGDDTWVENPVPLEARTLAPVVQQHWRSGSLATWQSFEAPVFSVQTWLSNGTVVPSTEKIVRQKCFCDGIAPCSHWSAAKQTVYHPMSGPGGSTWESSVDVLEDSARRLAQPEVCDACADEAAGEENLLRGSLALLAPRRLQVSTPLHIVWGMKVRQLGPFDLFVETDTEQVWMRDETFDPADPWAQRSIMRATENMPEELQVTSGTTWLQAFERWLTNRGLEFPARDFHGKSLEFLSGEGRRWGNQVLRNDANVAVIVKVEFQIGVTMGSGLDVTTATRDAWERYVVNRNSLASLKANKALQISSLWVNVEAQDGILRSTASTISTAILIGYVAAVLFTQDFLLSLFPMISVLLTVLCLLFTMVGILQWPFGAVDVIALIVFLGYMFTFNLHMAQYYNHAQIPMELLRKAEEKLSPAETRERVLRERFCRVNHALTSVGQSLVCSAGTTTASAIFLLCCTLQFFVKFGAVILAVTLLSILHSLMFLPSFLLFFGPTSKSCTNFSRLLGSQRGEAPAESCEGPVSAGMLKDNPADGGSEPPAPKPVTPPMPLPPLPPPSEPAEVIGSEEVDAVLSPSHPSPKGVPVVGFDSQDQDEEV